MRRYRVQKGEGRVGIAVVVYGLDQDREFEDTAMLRCGLGAGAAADHGEGEHHGDEGRRSPWCACQGSPRINRAARLYHHLPLLG